MPERPSISPQESQTNVRQFVLAWAAHRQGSAVELVAALEEELGWAARLYLTTVLDELRRARTEPGTDQKYLLYTLSAAAVATALHGETVRQPKKNEASCLDELFGRSRRYRRSRKFAEAVNFVARFHDYSAFNNMLVYLQNPLATYFATAVHWRKYFQRTIRDEARGMIILAPRTPVLLVYDVADTEGPPLPHKLDVFTRTRGRFNPMFLHRTIKNCARDRIRVERQPMGKLRGGFSVARVRDGKDKLRIVLRDSLDEGEAYAVLCHELAHVYLGHLGADKENGWPHRANLREAVAEIEAESVSYIVCRRAGLQTHSAEYLSTYTEDGDDLDGISLDLVTRAAGRIEEMGRRLLAPR